MDELEQCSSACSHLDLCFELSLGSCYVDLFVEDMLW